MLHGSSPRYIHARPLPGTGLDAVPMAWLPAHPRGYETVYTPNGGAPRTFVKPMRSGQEYAAAMPLRLSLPSRRVAEAAPVHQGPPATASCTPTPAADASVDSSAKLARLEEELRCARSELKALQVEWLEAKRPAKSEDDGSERLPRARVLPEQGLTLDPVQHHSVERPKEIPATTVEAPSSSDRDPLAALAFAWSRTQEAPTDPTAPTEVQASGYPSALPAEDSVPESPREEATGLPSIALPEARPEEVDAVDPEDSVDGSLVGVLPADVLSGSPVSRVENGPEEVGDAIAAEVVERSTAAAEDALQEVDGHASEVCPRERPEEDAFDGSGPDVPVGLQSASVMSEVQVDGAGDAEPESDSGHAEAVAAALAAESDPSEAGSNSAWVSTAAPNPLASSEGDPEEDAGAAATSGDEDPEAGASTARVSTAAPFPSRMMTDIASSESELQEVASSNSEAEQPEVRPSPMRSEDVSNEQATSPWPQAEEPTWPAEADRQWPTSVEVQASSRAAASAAWHAFASQAPVERGAVSRPQVTWQSPCTDLERLAASVEKLTEEMRKKWSVLEDLSHRLSQVEQSLRFPPSNTKVELLERRVEELEQQLKAMECQNGLNGELAEVEHNEAPSQDRGQHQVWL